MKKCLITALVFCFLVTPVFAAKVQVKAPNVVIVKGGKTKVVVKAKSKVKGKKKIRIRK